MKQYLDALKYCYDNGTDVESRAGSVRKSFGYQMHYDLSKGFPAITTKKLANMAAGPIAGFLTPKVNLGKLKGFVPAVKNDALSLSPINVIKAMIGRSVDGYMALQKCPKIEGFENMLNHKDYMKIISILIITIALLVLIKKPALKLGATAVILFLLYNFYK